MYFTSFNVQNDWLNDNMQLCFILFEIKIQFLNFPFLPPTSPTYLTPFLSLKFMLSFFFLLNADI